MKNIDPLGLEGGSPKESAQRLVEASKQASADAGAAIYSWTSQAAENFADSLKGKGAGSYRAEVTLDSSKALNMKGAPEGKVTVLLQASVDTDGQVAISVAAKGELQKFKLPPSIPLPPGTNLGGEVSFGGSWSSKSGLSGAVQTRLRARWSVESPGAGAKATVFGEIGVIGKYKASQGLNSKGEKVLKQSVEAGAYVRGAVDVDVGRWKTRRAWEGRASGTLALPDAPIAGSSSTGTQEVPEPGTPGTTEPQPEPEIEY